MHQQQRRRQTAANRLIAAIALAALPTVSLANTTYTWNGGDSTFGLFTQADNWLNNAVPPSSTSTDLAFGFLNPHGYGPTLNGNLDVNSLTFNSASLAYTVVTNGSGFSGILSLEGGGLNDASGNSQLITGATAVSLNASQPWNVSGAAFTDATPVNLNTSVLTLNTSIASGSATFSNALSGSGAASLTKTGVGSLVLNGSGTIPSLLLHGGATQISSGTYTLTSTSTPFNLNSATLNVSGGAVIDWSATSAFSVIDGASGTAAIVTGNNSKLKAGFQFDVGSSAQGSLTVTNGGLASGTSYFIVGDFTGSMGVLNISGGTVNAAEGIVGNFAGANGNATVTGSGSQWNLSSYLGIGGNAQTGAATGLLTISNGGAVTAPITTLYYGNSTININGGTLTTGGISSFQTGNGSIALANPASGNALNINGTSGTNTYSGGITGSGTLNKTGGSTQILSGTLNNTALFLVNGGTLVFNGSGSSIGSLTVQSGAANVSAGTLTIAPGSLTVTGGTATVNGNAKLFTPGLTGIDGVTGTNLTITGSSAFFNGSGGSVYVGENPGNTGTFNVLLGAQASAGQIIVPFKGSGILSIASGGVVSTSTAYLADSGASGSAGTATITGSNSAWNISGGLTIGAAGNTGSLNVNASGGVHVTGVTTFGLTNFPINISGGTFTTGALSNTGGYGVINLTSDPSGGTALTINGSLGSNTYSGAIYGGVGSLLKSGGSTQVLTGQLLTSGAITVTSGTLSFNSTQSNRIDAVSVQGGVANVSAGSLTLTNSSEPLDITGGTLNVNGAAQLIANTAMTSDLLDGTGSKLNVTSNGQLSCDALDLACVTIFSSVSMNISSGGLVNATSLALAAAPGTSATALVTGAGSTLNVSGGVSIGNTIGNNLDGIGSLSITSGGSVSAASCSFQDAAASITINGGTLSTGYLTSTHAGDGSITLTTDPSSGTAMIINDAASTDINTYSGTISGAGSFQKTGASTQILSGLLNTSASVTVSGGTLVFSGSGNSSIGSLLVTAGAANVSAGVITLSQSSQGLQVSGGNFNLYGGATFDATAPSSGFNYVDGPAGTSINVSGTGTLLKANDLLVGHDNTGTLNVSANAQVSAGTFFVPFSGTGILSISSGGIVTSTSAALNNNGAQTATVIVTDLGSAWNASSLAIGLSPYVSSGVLAINNSGGVNVSGVTTFYANGTPINISGGTFTTGGLASSGGSYGQINLINNSTGSYAMTINGGVGITSNYAGIISGIGRVQKTGTSTQILSGSGNSSITALSLQAGVVNLSAGTLTTTSTGYGIDVIGTLIISGGTLDASASTTFNLIDGSQTGTVNVTGANSLLKAGPQLYVGAVATDSGALNVSANGQVLADTINVPFGGTGVLNISSGGVVTCTTATLAAVRSGTMGTATIDGTGSAWNATNLSIGNPAGGSGVLNLNNNATVNITGTTSFNGSGAQLNLNAGVFTTAALSSSNTGYGQINTISGAILDTNATSGISTYSGSFSGSGRLQKDGGSTQIISGSFNSSGGVIVDNGALIFNNSGNNSIGTLVLNGGAANVSAGTYQLTSSGGGIRLIGGVLTVNGATLDASATTSDFNFIDGNPGTMMNATGAGTLIKTGSTLAVGELSSGTLNVSANAQVSGSAIAIPYYSTGTGVLNISSGGIVNYSTASLASTGGSATVTVTGPGSAFNLGSLSIGSSGSTGGLTINNSGGVTVTGVTTFSGNGVPINISNGTFVTGALASTAAGLGQINLITDPGGGTALTINDPVATDSNTYSGTIAGAGSLLKTGGSTQVLSGTDTFTGSVQVTGGVVEFASRNLFSSLVISGGTAQINGSGNILIVPTLAIISGGTLDITKDSADLPGSALATLNTLAQKGFNGGTGGSTWTGTGLTSSSAAADTRHLTAVGVIQNNQSGTALYTAANKFEGITPGVADVLAKYTYYGDTNLDGKVDGSDYSRIDAAFVADRINPIAVTGWFNGDFNYDGFINGSDYTLIDNAFNTQGAQLADAIANPTAQIAAASVPEPSSMLIIAMASIGLLRRRKASDRQSYSVRLAAHL